MKQLIVCLTAAVVALGTMAQAGDGKTCDKNKAACADKAKASAKVTCAEKAACCAKEKVAKKVSNPDEKGATFLVKR